MRIVWLSTAPEETLRAEVAARVPAASFEWLTDPGLALTRLHDSAFDALVAVLPLADWTGEELLEEALRVSSCLPVIAVLPESTPLGNHSEAVRLVKLGAFWSASRNDTEIAWAIHSAVEHRRTRQLALLGSAISQEPWRKFLIGESEAMQAVAHRIRLAGPRRSTVLITGETGTGKEMVARALHMAGPRSHLPMVAVNCSALPENLLEAELFGHVKGAFTGAFQPRMGRFEQAHRSTLFLDEIGDMPYDLQAKLLRVLQEREFQRLGSSDTMRVDVRVIAACNVNLIERVQQGRFREDLYYRLNVVPVHVPPLRDRMSDIPYLVNHFIDKVCRQEDLPPKEASPETVERLTRYSWPGNVRQLENAVEMAIALSADRRVLYPSDFSLAPATRRATVPAVRLLSLPQEGIDFEQTIGRIERDLLHQALERTHGNKKAAADLLRLKRTTLAAKLKTLDSPMAEQAELENSARQ